MVPSLCGIVENASVGFADNVFQTHVLEGRSGYQFVQVVHVGLQVLAVMVF